MSSDVKEDGITCRIGVGCGNCSSNSDAERGNEDALSDEPEQILGGSVCCKGVGSTQNNCSNGKLIWTILKLNALRLSEKDKGCNLAHLHQLLCGILLVPLRICHDDKGLGLPHAVCYDIE